MSATVSSRVVGALDDFVETSLDEALAGADDEAGAQARDKAEAIADSIVHHLLRLNSEFAHYVPAERQRPRIELAALGDPDYFPVGVKHRYTRR